MRSLILFALVLVSPVGALCSASDTSQVGPAARIVPVDAGELKKLREEARGKVLLVNFWATWCAPCVEEFPDLIKLRGEYGPRGLAVLFVSIDRASEAGTTVAQFLQKHGVTFRTYIKKAGGDEDFINAMSRNWSGALPATFIYDKTGKLAHLLSGEQSLQSLSRYVQPLLGQ